MNDVCKVEQRASFCVSTLNTNLTFTWRTSHQELLDYCPCLFPIDLCVDCYWLTRTFKKMPGYGNILNLQYSKIPCTNYDLTPAGIHTYPVQSSASGNSSDSLLQVALHFVPVHLFSRHQGTPCSHNALFDHVPTEYSNQHWWYKIQTPMVI